MLITQDWSIFVNEAVVGIVVGIVVAVTAQVLSSLAELILERRKEERQARGVCDLLRHEISQHLERYRGLLLWAEASIERGGKDHTDYSYERVRTHAYNQVFLVHWHLLPDDVVRSVVEYYAFVQILLAKSPQSSTASSENGECGTACL